MQAFTTQLAHLLLTLPLYLMLACWLAAAHGHWRGPGSPWHRWRVSLVLAGLAVWAVSAPVLPNRLIAALEARHAPMSLAAQARLAAHDGPTILVLSSGWFRYTDHGPRAQLDTASWERTLAAVTLWQRSGGRLLFSGGPGPDGSASVARRMADVAQMWGVPADRIGVEEASTNTHENLAYSAPLLRTGGSSATVLVTSAMHMPRALAIAERIGLDVLPYPCDFRADATSPWRDWLPANAAPGLLEDMLHEWIGLWVYRWRGWA